MEELSPEKRNFVNTFLSEPRIARMATANREGQPHVVPVWYAWDGNTLWISAYADTRKVKDLQENPLISVAIDEVSQDGKMQAVILEGKAVLLHEPAELLKRQFTWIYSRYVGADHVSGPTYQDWINDPLNALIKLTPARISAWSW
jgi:PPOX class probable F420-dependent enzyme